MPQVSSFDYIVVGAGTAGCVVAARLAGHASTLLLEAGGPDTGMQNGVDVGDLIQRPDRLIESWESPVTRKYVTEPETGLGGRPMTIHRGVVRGGSHSVNGMIYVRGNRRDYDTWAQLGNDGWSFDEVLPYFKAAEHFDPGPVRCDPHDRGFHGTGGPVQVRPLPDPTPAATAFIEAARELGFARSHAGWDFNGARQDNAAGLYHVTVTADGRRASTAAAYLDGRVAPPEHLTVRMYATATRILVENGRAVGVECLEGGEPHVYRALREVIVTAGAFGSPKLLMLSGIGPAEHLKRLGIQSVVDLPGVGRNLHDHLQILIFHPAAAGRDPGQARFTAESGLFTHTVDRSGAAAPDLQYHVLGRMPTLPSGIAQALNLPDRYFLICPVLCKPQSRGRLRLRSRNAASDPIIEPSYLRCDADVQALLRGIALARELAETAPLRAFQGGGPFAIHGATYAHVPVPSDAAALRQFVTTTATTVWHPAGTCKMGRDELAVVDPALKVYGVEGLRVADASIMPTVVAGNINAVCIMIGEKCADLVAGRRRPASDERSAPPPPAGPREERRLPSEPAGVMPDYAAVIQSLGQMALAFTEGGIRYWGRAAEIWASGVPSVLRALAEASTARAPSSDAPRAVLEELRAGLQQFMAIAPEQARELQAELERITGAAARPQAPAAAPDATQWRRRARAKP